MRRAFLAFAVLAVTALVAVPVAGAKTVDAPSTTGTLTTTPASIAPGQ